MSLSSRIALKVMQAEIDQIAGVIPEDNFNPKDTVVFIGVDPFMITKGYYAVTGITPTHLQVNTNTEAYYQWFPKEFFVNVSNNIA